MATPLTNKEFIRRFVNDEIDTHGGERRHGNLRVHDGVLFSYGTHHPLATRFGAVWLVSDKVYSSTTAQHRALVVQALPSMDTAHVPGLAVGPGGQFDLTDQVDRLIAALSACATRLETRMRSPRVKRFPELRDIQTYTRTLAMLTGAQNHTTAFMLAAATTENAASIADLFRQLDQDIPA